MLKVSNLVEYESNRCGQSISIDLKNIWISSTERSKRSTLFVNGVSS